MRGYSLGVDPDEAEIYELLSWDLPGARPISSRPGEKASRSMIEKMKKIAAIACLLLAAVALCQAQVAPTAPSYILTAGLSFDSGNGQVSNVNTLAVKTDELSGLPNYLTFTMETAIVRAANRLGWSLDKTATLRIGTWQTIYQTPGRLVSLGLCADGGFTKVGDGPTLGTLAGCGGAAVDVGKLVTKGKAHVFVVPSYRLVTLSGVQVAPSYQIRVGTGL